MESQTFPQRLIIYRNNLHISQRALAGGLGVNVGYYNIIENGKRKPSEMFISKLITLSGKSNEYWMSGIEESNKTYKKSKSEKILEFIPILQQLDERSLDLVIETAKSYVPTLEEQIKRALPEDAANKVINYLNSRETN